MRNLREMVEREGRVYVCLESDKAKEDFLLDAKQEGFAFTDGTLPDIDAMDDIYAIHSDLTIRHLGWAGHVLYHNVKQGNLPEGRKFHQINYDD